MALRPFYHQEIRHHSLFNRLSDESFQFILQNSGLVSIKKNSLLFEQGYEANHFFMVRKGQIIFFLTSFGGNEKIVDIFESGQTCAEAIIFSKDPCYPVNARSTCDTELFYFDAQIFKTLLQQSNELCFSMMAAMSDRLKAQTQEIIELSICDAQHRLINYLLKKSRQEHDHHGQPIVELSITKSLLASRLSITPETFSRILTRLKKQGLITFEYDTIILNEPQKLRNIIGQGCRKLPEKTKKSALKWQITKKAALQF